MSGDALRLTAVFGERDQVHGRTLSDVALDRFARDGLATSALLRGLSGFGPRRGLRTDSLLTLSEDLPLTAVAVDAPERIEPLAAWLAPLLPGGLLTVEATRLVDGPPGALAGDVRLTVHVGRRERVGRRSAARAVVDVAHAHGVSGATVLLGVDGTVRGERRRAALLGRNADVPIVVDAIGGGEAVRAAAAELGGMLTRPRMTIDDGVTLLKRDGRGLAAPPPDDHDGGRWARIAVYASEVSRSADGAPLHVALVRALGAAGAPGTTALRGVWGYHGDHAPHGDRLLALRRRVPVVAFAVDRADALRERWDVVDAVTAETGLVTWERIAAVPAGLAP